MNSNFRRCTFADVHFYEESYFLDSASDTSDSDETDFIDYISSSLVVIDE